MIDIKFKWCSFVDEDCINIPSNVASGKSYLVLLSVRKLNEEEAMLAVDNATPGGCFVDNYWDTEKDYPDSEVHVLAWADPREAIVNWIE